jgi:hypothetical protein
MSTINSGTYEDQDEYADTGTRELHWSYWKELVEISRFERAQAKVSQERAKIFRPLKTGFQNDLDPEVTIALTKLWETGPQSRDLYVKIGKGLAAMTRDDLITLIESRTPEEIESLTGELAKGWSLRALDRNREKVPDPDI